VSLIHNEQTNWQHVLVDGGMLSNFPVWLFDCQGRDPKFYEHTMRLLTTDYTQLYDHDSYTIYMRK